MIVRQTRSHARRRAILDAALASFDEQGYELTSIQEIRQRSGASVGSIYHQFGDKSGIAAALYRDGLRDYQETILAALGPDTERGVRRVVRAHLRWVEENPALGRFLDTRRELELALTAEPEVSQATRDFQERVAAWLEPRIESGELRKLPPELCLSVMIGPVQGYTRAWLSGAVKIAPRQAARWLPDTTWTALAGNDSHAAARNSGNSN